MARPRLRGAAVAVAALVEEAQLAAVLGGGLPAREPGNNKEIGPSRNKNTMISEARARRVYRRDPFAFRLGRRGRYRFFGQLIACPRWREPKS